VGPVQRITAILFNKKLYSRLIYTWEWHHVKEPRGGGGQQQNNGPKLYERLMDSWGWHHLKEPVHKTAAILRNKTILVTNLQLGLAPYCRTCA